MRAKVFVDRARRTITLHLGVVDPEMPLRRDVTRRRERVQRLFDDALAQFGNEFILTEPADLRRVARRVG